MCVCIIYMQSNAAHAAHPALRGAAWAPPAQDVDVPAWTPDMDQMLTLILRHSRFRFDEATPRTAHPPPPGAAPDTGGLLSGGAPDAKLRCHGARGWRRPARLCAATGASARTRPLARIALPHPRRTAFARATTPSPAGCGTPSSTCGRAGRSVGALHRRLARRTRRRRRLQQRRCREARE